MLLILNLISLTMIVVSCIAYRLTAPAFFIGFVIWVIIWGNNRKPEIATAEPSSKPEVATAKPSSKPVFLLGVADTLDGHSFEVYVRTILLALGFPRVDRTRKSGDFGADLVAYAGAEKWVIQCKRQGNKVGNRAVQEVFAAQAYYGATKAIVLTNNFFTSAAISQARSAGVLLWDRRALAALMDRANGGS